jgi:predicted transcriptional regulator
MDIQFTDREIDVMEVLWERGPSLVGDVRAALKDDLAYTTVLTILRTLEGKRYVGHEQEGRGHRYFATVKQQAAQQSACVTSQASSSRDRPNCSSPIWFPIRSSARSRSATCARFWKTSRRRERTDAGLDVYVIVVSLLLSLAALALERSARVRQKPTRWLWGTSMIASLLVPLVISSVSVQIPRLTGVVDPAIPQRVVALRQMTASGLSPSGWLTTTAGPFSASPDLDRLLQVGWSAAATILLLAILAGSLQLNWCRRRWERGNMAGVPVHISEDAGPAIVGLLDPHIVVPRWLMRCPPDVQELVIAHEQGHLEAHDARLVTIALGLLVCMPWNLPLWWQLRRLRLAVEIDCDARVLRRGYDVSRYGETLIAVGERQSATIAMVAAMSEPRSLLEQRIRNMLRKKTSYAHATAVALACLGSAFAVGAAKSPPNNDDPAKSASQESAVDTRIMMAISDFTS